MMVLAYFDPPPIPDRRFDWRAVTSDYEPGDPMGEGPTEEAAIADLKAQIEERQAELAEAIAQDQRTRAQPWS